MKLMMGYAQKQVLVQQMIQSMKVLQMNTLELESYINELSMENPTIELLENSKEEGKTREELNAERKLNWLESMDYQNVVYYKDDEGDVNLEANWQDIKDCGESLSDYLKAQIIHKKYTVQETKILEYIIDSLDSSGYFVDDLEKVALYLDISYKKVEEMLLEVQALDPAGVGAKNVQECLLLQIERDKENTDMEEDMHTIIAEYLPLVAKNHFNVIARKMKLSVGRIQECCDKIRSLNPKPGNIFNDRSHFQYVSPDIVVVKLGKEFDILVNEYQYPQFKANSYYESLAKKTDDKETKEYLKEKLKQTYELKDSINYRISTLLRVAHLLVEKQIEFFLYGPGHKNPLQLMDFVDELDLHPSTVSRALNNKYLQCSWGIYPLNYFLTSSVVDGQENNTQEKIILLIEQIVESEDKKKPYSDQKISDMLKQKGIEISRRTVSKYRNIKGIPDKSGRKQI